MNKTKIAISIGDLNGVGIEIALKSHNIIKKFCEPIYCINENMLNRALKLLNLNLPSNFIISNLDGDFNITPSLVTKESGEFSFNSFINTVNLAKETKVDAIITLPIHKEAWAKAGINYKGHTDCLRDIFKKNAIMMLGCEKMFVGLYTEHIPLREVVNYIQKEKLIDFLIDFYNEVKNEKIAVLGINPHAGDNGVLGDEDFIINEAIKLTNKKLNKNIFIGSIVPDTAYTPKMRSEFNYFVAMYHDQGLAPLKALYFDESINVSLNLPIIRTSVDHGTAFDIAYKNLNPNNLSYINAIQEAIKLSNLRKKC